MEIMHLTINKNLSNMHKIQITTSLIKCKYKGHFLLLLLNIAYILRLLLAESDNLFLKDSVIV